MRKLIFLLAMTLAASSANAQGAPSLFMSVAKGDEAAVKRLANKDTVNQLTRKGKHAATPLILAVMNTMNGTNDRATMMRIIDTLLARGADPNIPAPFGNTQASIVDFLVFLDKATAHEKPHNAEEAEKYKYLKLILARLRQHGGVGDKKRIAAVEKEILGSVAAKQQAR